MTQVLEQACVQCGRSNAESALLCGLCGNVLRHESRTARIPPPVVAPIVERAQATRADDRASAPSRSEPWLYLGIGLVTAPIFAWTPILQYMGWFLSALVHEMGHAAISWFCGMPAIPAISLAGHAAAVHQEQSVVLALAIPCALAAAAWHFLEGRARWIAIGFVTVLYPVIAFTGVKEFLHLLAGHGGELAFATLCLWKALDGGFTESKAERALYGTVGWYLLGNNAFMCLGLMTSSAARSAYSQNGSFGLTNDYIRVAEDVLSWRVESVALLMLFACAAVLPVALGLWRASTAMRREMETGVPSLRHAGG